MTVVDVKVTFEFITRHLPALTSGFVVIYERSQ
jgi:hypothetical protein